MNASGGAQPTEYRVEVIGHAWAVDLLQRQLSADRLAHAYLFTGPPHVGKSTLARWFAQTLLCERGTAAQQPGLDMLGGLEPPTTEAKGLPCGSCRSCRQVANGTHPDLRRLNLELQPGERRTLGIEAIRELRSGVAERPFAGQRKVYWIEDAETLTVEAANALLKTLEEPPSFVTILLVALSDHLLLDTIVSRCQLLALRPLAREQVAGALQKRWGADPETASLLASLSLGRPGWAVQALQDEHLLQQREQDLSALLELLGAGLLERFSFAARQNSRWKKGEHEELFTLLERWQGWWRDLLMIGHGCEELVSNIDRLAELRAVGRQVGPLQAHEFVQALWTARQHLGEQVNPGLLFEQLLLQMPTVLVSPSTPVPG
ncbi:MAG: DNA polymerase III subunit delta' [Chloroflexia bacterium]|nr:DNA polymerase III subunit delta' [Chloroflexia bacterium]